MTAEQIVAWLSECSDWMLANDLDMQCPMETDPVDVADAVTALQATVERQATEIARLREALTVIRGSGKAGTWSAVTEPLVGRFDVASKFGGDAVHNAEGSMALAELLRAMASKLDNACVAARQALGEKHDG